MLILKAIFLNFWFKRKKRLLLARLFHRLVYIINPLVIKSHRSVGNIVLMLKGSLPMWKC